VISTLARKCHGQIVVLSYHQYVQSFLLLTQKLAKLIPFSPFKAKIEKIESGVATNGQN